MLLMETGTPVVTGMEALATAIKTAISTDTMLANLTTLIPTVGVIVIFAFTYRMVKKLLKGASKGKASI